MTSFFKNAGLLLLSLTTISGYSQETQTSWRWANPQQKNIELYIGNDTITKNAAPFTRDAHWWKSFGYPMLDSLIDKALDNNIDLKITEARVNQARAARQISMAALFPSIKLEPTFTREAFPANRPNPFGGEINSAILNTYQVPLTLSYELDIFGKNSDLMTANALAAEASEEDRKNMLLQVKTEVALNFFLILQLDAEYDLLAHTEKTRSDNLEITSTRYNAGLVSQIDVLRAKTELSSVQVQRKNNRLLRADMELALAPLIGAEASSFHIPDTKIKYLPPSVAFLEKDSLAMSRPDLRAKALLLNSSEKLVNSQWKELLPSFYVNGAYGYLSGERYNLIEQDSKAWLVGVSASFSIFEGGRKKSELHLKQSRLQEAEENYNKQLLESYKQVEASYSRLKWISDQLLAQQEFVAAARDAANLTNERYRKGLENYINVVDADRQVLEAERLSVQLFGKELMERVSLIRALGDASTN